MFYGETLGVREKKKKIDCRPKLLNLGAYIKFFE